MVGWLDERLLGFFFLLPSSCCVLLSGAVVSVSGEGGEGKAGETYVDHYGQGVARVCGWLWVESRGWQATDNTGFFRIHLTSDDGELPFSELS